MAIEDECSLVIKVDQNLVVCSKEHFKVELGTLLAEQVNAGRPRERRAPQLVRLAMLAIDA